MLYPNAENYEDINYYQYVPDLECPKDLYNETLDILSREEGVIYCNSTFDMVTCWPTTRAGEEAVMPCPKEYMGLVLLNSNVTKQCFLNGSWADNAAYTRCILSETNEGNMHSWVAYVIFCTGNTISTVAIIMALFIFWYFKTLRCRRNIIHCHLMGSFFFKNVLWLLMSVAFIKFISVEYVERDTRLSASTTWICRSMVTVYNYLHLASFFWMFVEGLYLHKKIVWPFSADKVRFWTYALLGWGVPVPIITVWIIVRVTLHNDSCWIPIKYQHAYYDLIFTVPILFILLINIIFLVSIEIVLITKLKASSGGSSSQGQRQYKRAVKGTLILFPLLGLIYVIFITPPGGHPIGQMLYLYTNAILQSFQDFLVALFFCFLNTEVRQTIGKRIRQWKTSRTVSPTYS